MKPNPLVALYHFTVLISWRLASKGCPFAGDLKLARGGLDGAAVLLSMHRHEHPAAGETLGALLEGPATSWR
jgi:hypothetical protein